MLYRKLQATTAIVTSVDHIRPLNTCNYASALRAVQLLRSMSHQLRIEEKYLQNVRNETITIICQIFVKGTTAFQNQFKKPTYVFDKMRLSINGVCSFPHLTAVYLTEEPTCLCHYLFLTVLTLFLYEKFNLPYTSLHLTNAYVLSGKNELFSL